ncbi:hypothetical protein LTS18_011601, partial [Coniosporium uncinatum]
MAMYGSTRNVDMGKQESELAINIRKATSVGTLHHRPFNGPWPPTDRDILLQKRRRLNSGKHVRAAIVYTWDHKSSASFWSGMKVQPILADEVQTFKALITTHKVLQEGHPIVLREAQANISWIESLKRGTTGYGSGGGRGYGDLIHEY